MLNLTLQFILQIQLATFPQADALSALVPSYSTYSDVTAQPDETGCTQPIDADAFSPLSRPKNSLMAHAYLALSRIRAQTAGGALPAVFHLKQRIISF
ncbi:hypothetical protein [Dickeya poaceiphila]|uniref:Uncharacterized protein n=1 Tax=Dickeya poaceiphila TaxID=568768 RepID=A0A5B8ID91_9GAMM|nr:hypothetical protein [Dickeya poaceiphila]QDX30597.1 hypothetical protein Dpoa569_0002509 [Dickeya poaceiphila]